MGFDRSPEAVLGRIAGEIHDYVNRQKFGEQMNARNTLEWIQLYLSQLEENTGRYDAFGNKTEEKKVE